MADVRDLRRQTREAIARQKRDNEQKILKLKNYHEAQERELLNQLAQQREEHQRQLDALQARIRREVDAAHHEIADTLRRQEAELRRRMDQLEQDTVTCLEELHEEMAQKANEIQEQFQKDVEAVYQRINDQRLRSQLYAEDCMERLTDVLRAANENTAVTRFRPQQAELMTQEYNGLLSSEKKGDWHIVIPVATQLYIKVESLRIEAEHAQRVWQRKHDDVSARLRVLTDQREDDRNTSSVLKMGTHIRYQTTLADWVPETLAKLDEKIAAQTAVMDAFPTIQQMNDVNQQITPLSEQRFRAMRLAQHELTIYLLILDAIKCCVKCLKEENGWHPQKRPTFTEDTPLGDDQHRRIGSILLWKDFDTLKISATRSRGTVPTVAVTLELEGPDADALRRKRLNTLILRLGNALSAYEAGGLAVGQAVPYMDGRICCARFTVSTDALEPQVIAQPENEETVAGEAVPAGVEQTTTTH